MYTLTKEQVGNLIIKSNYFSDFCNYLTIYLLKIYLDKAVEVANAFMPAFSTATGYSFSLFNPVR